MWKRNTQIEMLEERLELKCINNLAAALMHLRWAINRAGRNMFWPLDGPSADNCKLPSPRNVEQVRQVHRPYLIPGIMQCLWAKVLGFINWVDDTPFSIAFSG